MKSFLSSLRSLAALLMTGVWLLATAGCSPVTMTLGGDPQNNELIAKVVEKGGEDRIAIVDVSGTLYNANHVGLLGTGENPVSLLREQLDLARQDSRVKAVVLRLNTPGGTVTASDVMYREVLRFKKESRKPVVGLMMDITCSGGYYVACAADELVAHPTTITGSIGVILQTVSVKPALARWGIETEAITSGPNKDAGSPLSVMTAEHRATLRALVDRFYARFVSVVREARPNIPAGEFARVTDGRVLGGEDALAAGLVDRLGDLHDAVEAAKVRAKIKRADVIVYHRPTHYAGSAYAGTGVGPVHAGGNGGTGTQINLAQLNIGERLGETGAGFYYIWEPRP